MGSLSQRLERKKKIQLLENYLYKSERFLKGFKN